MRVGRGIVLGTHHHGHTPITTTTTQPILITSVTAAYTVHSRCRTLPLTIFHS